MPAVPDRPHRTVCRGTTQGLCALIALLEFIHSVFRNRSHEALLTGKWATLIGALVLWAGCVLPLPAQQGAPVSPDSEIYGKTVRKIELRGAMAGQAERLLGYVAQPAGRPLDRTLVRRSVQALYASGFFSDIGVEAEPVSANQVDLAFVTTPRHFIGSLTIEGALRSEPSGKQVLAAAKLQLGQPWGANMVEAAIERMKSALTDGGYYRAEIGLEQTEHLETQLVDLRFQVTPGERARVGEVRVEGDSGFTAAEVMRIAKVHPGDPVKESRVTRALERLRKAYQKQRRLESQVVLKDRVHREATNTVDFAFQIRRGPEVGIEVQGAHPSPTEVRKLIPVYEENAVDEDLLNEGRRNLRDHMQTRGYFDATVGYSKQDDSAGGRRSIVYQVERGERHKLVEIAITGNRYFDEDLIRERLWMHEAEWLLSYGRFSQSILASDLDAIRALYTSNGFASVQVSSQVEQIEGGRLRVLLNVEEGPQSRVVTLAVHGNQAVNEEEIRSMISTIEGQPFSEANVQSDRELLRNFYFNRGFPEATLEIGSQPDPANATRVHVTFEIHEGPQFFVDRVLVNGLHYTRPETVSRQVRIQPGSPLSLADMLETQRRLYDLGLFNEVDIGVQNPEGDARSKNVLIQVEEASRWTFDYGAGFEVQTGVAGAEPQGGTEASPRFSFDLTRINFRGRDHTLVFKSRVGRLQQRGLVSYIAPRWFDKENLRLSLTAFFDSTSDVRTFTSERLEGSVQADQTLSKATTLLYRFAFRRVQVDEASLKIDPAQIPLLSQPVRVGIPSLTYIRDTRDDPINSTKGLYLTTDVGISSKVFGSEAGFWRLFLQNSTYHAFRRRRFVLARSTRIGFTEPFDSGVLIPLPERLFTGGGSSHRGFAINQAGPRDRETGFPVGGQALFLNNVELRLPTVTLPYLRENVGFVLFHDAGNVFESARDLFRGLTRFTQPDRGQCRLLSFTARCDLNYLSHAFGGGLRYQTPIGPVRVDFGYNLNPPTFPIRSEGRSETLRHFNLFFSIGQTF